MTKLRDFVRHNRGLVGGSAVFVLLFVAGMVYFAKLLNEPVPEPKRVIQEIALVRPPPPPPPPEEEPPPPPEIEEEVDMPEPEQMPDPIESNEPPPGPLGLDADGAAGADGFGLLARRGGRDLLASGGDRFGWYAGILQRDIVDYLTGDDRLRSSDYDVNVRLWLARDGSVEQIEVVRGSGDVTLDERLRVALQTMSRVAEAPPDDLPQPILLRIRSRT